MGKIAYQALLEKMGKRAVFDPDEPPTEAELAEWQLWSKTVFMPLNGFREKLILENAFLIREEDMPECLLQFVTHVSAYKAILAKWDSGDFSELTPSVDYPEEIEAYATRSYQELKAEQLSLIGKLQ